MKTEDLRVINNKEEKEIGVCTYRGVDRLKIDYYS